MRTLADYRKDVDGLESGECPTRFRDHTEAIKALVDEVCSTPWRDAGERAEAQRLVCRLERLRRNPPPPA